MLSALLPFHLYTNIKTYISIQRQYMSIYLDIININKSYIEWM